MCFSVRLKRKMKKGGRDEVDKVIMTLSKLQPQTRHFLTMGCVDANY